MNPPAACLFIKMYVYILICCDEPALLIFDVETNKEVRFKSHTEHMAGIYLLL